MSKDKKRSLQGIADCRRKLRLFCTDQLAEHCLYTVLIIRFAVSEKIQDTRRYVLCICIASRQHSILSINVCFPSADEHSLSTAVECSALLGSSSLISSRFPDSQIIVWLLLLA